MLPHKTSRTYDRITSASKEMDEHNKMSGEGSNWCGCPMCKGWKMGMDGMCGRHHFKGHFLVRILLGLVLLFIVSAVGFRLGEFKGEFKNYTGYSDGFRHMPMMNDLQGNYWYYQQ